VQNSHDFTGRRIEASFVAATPEAEHGLLKPLLKSLHRCDQDGYPMSGWVAGLPGTVSRLITRGQTYTERIALYPVGMLDRPAVDRAVREPFAVHGVVVDDEVIAVVHRESGGYPFFVQGWGEALWNATARADRVTVADVDAAGVEARIRADDLMRARWSRLSPRVRGAGVRTRDAPMEVKSVLVRGRS